MGFYLSHPVFKGIEGSPIIDSIDHNDAHCPFVVGLRDGLEAFLAGGIPDLQSDLLAVNVDRLDLEVDADGGQVRGHEIVLAKPQQNVGLADAAVADDQQFGQVVVVLVPSHAKNQNNRNNQFLLVLVFI